MAGIEPVVDRTCEAFEISLLRHWVPRLGMPREPSFLFLGPEVEFGLGEGVGQAPSGEDPLLTLLPMGKIVLRLLDVLPEVEELGHNGESGFVTRFRFLVERGSPIPE